MVVVVAVVVVVTCQASAASKRPPHSSKTAWEGRAVLPKKKEKGPSYTEPTAPAKAVRDDSPREVTELPEFPDGSWWNERMCRRRGERWEAPEARVLPGGCLMCQTSLPPESSGLACQASSPYPACRCSHSPPYCATDSTGKARRRHPAHSCRDDPPEGHQHVSA